MQPEQKEELSRIHYFTGPVSKTALPEKFTCPFHYQPHPLCIAAAEEVQAYLETRADWHEELRSGKMFGVLAVRTPQGQIAYIAAFSGILAGKNLHSFFVPPVYDVQQPDGFFRKEEQQISALNARIKALEQDSTYLQKLENQAALVRQANRELAQMKQSLQEAKARRDLRRKDTLPPSETQRLIRESQFGKAEYKRLGKSWKERIAQEEAEINRHRKEIEALKAERKKRSAALQQQLFAHFVLLNARHETKDLCRIFEESGRPVPPAGAGECAAPKMLQYAYRNSLQPLAMAEFWWGESPRTELRRHGYFYPACKNKCEPILNFMLQGLEVEDNLLQTATSLQAEPEILYEDAWLLVVNKPAGMLSVPGKSGKISVWQWIHCRFPSATGPLLVHRLDMSTSGLLLIAKTKEVHKLLQAQFEKRSIQKRYTALLDGLLPQQEGTIDLPLCPDPTDRPRQIVSPVYGKPARTRYQVLGYQGNHTLAAFYPVTGRTHQLRVHAAHPQGLNTPILGDPLYGRRADRLYLHAEKLRFAHPITGKILEIEKKADFLS